MHAVLFCQCWAAWRILHTARPVSQSVLDNQWALINRRPNIRRRPLMLTSISPLKGHQSISSVCVCTLSSAEADQLTHHFSCWPICKFFFWLNFTFHLFSIFGMAIFGNRDCSCKNKNKKIYCILAEYSSFSLIMSNHEFWLRKSFSRRLLIKLIDFFTFIFVFFYSQSMTVQFYFLSSEKRLSKQTNQLAVCFWELRFWDHCHLMAVDKICQLLKCSNKIT